MTPEEFAAETTRLAAEYARHGAAIEPHVKAQNEIKARLRELYAGQYGTHPAGGLQVGIQRNSTFDSAAFAAQYPPELNPTFYKQVPNSKAIPENLREQFQKHGDAKVVIK